MIVHIRVLDAEAWLRVHISLFLFNRVKEGHLTMLLLLCAHYLFVAHVAPRVESQDSL